MTRPLLALLVAGTTALLAGCASGTRFSGPAEVPADKAEVYIYRTGKLVGFAQSYEILANDERKASLKNASFVRFQLPPGNHQIVARPEILSALSAKSSTATAALRAEPGKRYFYLFSVNSTASGDSRGTTYYVTPNSLSQVSEPIAVREMSQLNAAD